MVLCDVEIKKDIIYLRQVYLLKLIYLKTGED